MNNMQSIDCEMCYQDEIDWEQRRYEIAREMFATLMGDHIVLKEAAENHLLRCVAKCAVDCADILIAELQKEKQ